MTADETNPTSDSLTRCGWASSLRSRRYHDLEWGVPLHDDRALLEMLILEGAQAGLSWETILKKRRGYQEAFDNFDANKIALYKQDKIDQLLANPGVVRNRLKIAAAVQNARSFLAIRDSYGTFDIYIWGFIGGSPRCNNRLPMDEVPAHTHQSDAMSKDLKARGFKFVGTTICYAFMQATGMVNDHTIDCYRHSQIASDIR